MTFGAALLYFLTESVKGLWRNWKVSVVAVAAISASLALAAAFWLVCANAADLLAGWRADSRVSVYFTQEASEADVRELATRIEALPGVENVVVVDPAAAAERLRDVVPQLLRGLQRRHQPPALVARGARRPAAGDLRPACPPPTRSCWSTTTATGWPSSSRCCWCSRAAPSCSAA